MKGEFPTFARCCFCFPLRYGLLTWLYTKLVLIVWLFLNLLVFSITEIFNSGPRFKQNLTFFIITCIMVLFLSVDIVFHILCIISAHRKDPRKMRWFYKEALFGLGVYIFGFVYVVTILVVQFSFYGLYLGSEILGLIFLFISIQAYLIVLVRSEVLKLEKNMNFQFTNYTTHEERSKVDTSGVIV